MSGHGDLPWAAAMGSAVLPKRHAQVLTSPTSECDLICKWDLYR